MSGAGKAEKEKDLFSFSADVYSKHKASYEITQRFESYVLGDGTLKKRQ
jgi:hypothetical protein